MKRKKIAIMLLAASVLSSVGIAGCGKAVDAGKTAATLDGKEISVGVANFMAQCQAVQMDAYMLSYYGEDMWTSDSGDGETMTDSVKKGVMENIQEYYLMDAHAKDYGVELSDEEKAEITQAAAKFLEDNSEEAKNAMGATQETVEEMLRLYKIQSKVRAAIVEDIDTDVADEECAQKTFSYVRLEKAADADTAADDAQTEEDKKEKAGEFFESAKDGLEAAAEAGGYTVSKCSYGKGDLSEDGNTTGMDLAVLQAADKLKEGEMVDSLIETDSYYYVARMDSLDDKEAAQSKKESILSKRRTEKYDEVLEGYREDCEWKVSNGEWGKVNFDILYTQKAAEGSTATDDGAGDADGSQTVTE